MASIKALCLAGVASLAVTAAANAADLLPQAPMPEPVPVYAPAPAGLGGGWYLRGDVGVGIADLKQNDSTFNPANVPPGIRYNQNSLDDSGIIDIGAGYRFNEYFRADVTGEYSSAAHFSAAESYNIGAFYKPKTNDYAFDYYTGSFQTIAGLVNGYVDLGTWYGVTPFAGAGVGVARIGINNLIDSGDGLGGSHSQTNFAFAVMAGLDFAVTQNLKLEIGYKYLDMGKVASGTIVCQNEGAAPCPNEVQHFHLASNNIRLGFRYMFADYAPAPEPIQQMPLIRKY